MLGAAASLIGGLAGCTAASEEVRPPEDALVFPTGMVMAPDSSVLFVANANSELRYDSGSIAVVDLNSVDAVIQDWLANRDAKKLGCEVDPEHRETLVCDEGRFLRAGAGVRIGNFATELALQSIGPATAIHSRLRVFAPTRGDPSIAWADYDTSSGALSCSSASGFPLCDDEHRLTFVGNNPDNLAIADEPFGVFADSANEFAIVSHQVGGAVTLIDSPRNGTVQISDLQTGLFSPDPTTGIRAATGLAGRMRPVRATDGTQVKKDGYPVFEDIIYVGSRSEDRIQNLVVERPLNGAPPYLLPAGFFFLEAVGSTSGSSSDTRGMQMSPDGNRLYLVNRRPPSIQIFDTSLSDTGVPRNVATGASDICRQASTLTVFNPGVDAASVIIDERVAPDPDERAYVTCFQTGEVYVVDPSGTSRVEDVITVGRGPYAAAGSGKRGRLYITNFLEDTIAVVDVKPGSATRNRVVLRIGTPRSTQ